MNEVLGTSRDYTGTVRQRLDRLLNEEGTVDVIFVHRDADAPDATRRRTEILGAASSDAQVPSRVIPVVPVQELEAWLLLDEGAIREIVGKPSGRVALRLPKRASVEGVAHPKEVLREALLVASETTGRRRDVERRRFGDRRRVLLERLDIDGPVADLTAWRQLVKDVDDAAKALAAQDGTDQA